MDKKQEIIMTADDRTPCWAWVMCIAFLVYAIVITAYVIWTTHQLLETDPNLIPNLIQKIILRLSNRMIW